MQQLAQYAVAWVVQRVCLWAWSSRDVLVWVDPDGRCRRVNTMRYAIIANPICHGIATRRWRRELASAARVLGAKVHGLDTKSTEQFRLCAQELSAGCDILVVAGGDGSFSDVINAIDTIRTPLAFLPLGQGNALKYALEYRRGLSAIVDKIRQGTVREFDLIDCDGRQRAFAASIGFDGVVIHHRERYRAKGSSGLLSYSRAFMGGLKDFSRCDAELRVDGWEYSIRGLLSLMVVKQPYFGFGMKVVPQARFDDGKLHVRVTNAGAVGAMLAAVSSFTVGNRIGEYLAGKNVELKLERALLMQADGGEAWRANCFKFAVLPRALRMVG